MQEKHVGDLGDILASILTAACKSGYLTNVNPTTSTYCQAWRETRKLSS